MSLSKQSVIMGIAFTFSIVGTLALPLCAPNVVSNALYLASGVALLYSVTCFVISKKREPQTSRRGLYVIGITLLAYAFVYFVLI